MYQVRLHCIAYATQGVLAGRVKVVLHQAEPAPPECAGTAWLEVDLGRSMIGVVRQPQYTVADSSSVAARLMAKAWKKTAPLGNATGTPR